MLRLQRAILENTQRHIAFTVHHSRTATLVSLRIQTKRLRSRQTACVTLRIPVEQVAQCCDFRGQFWKTPSVTLRSPCIIAERQLWSACEFKRRDCDPGKQPALQCGYPWNRMRNA